MGIKHKAVKASDEKGYAIEWNDEHIVDSDINFNNFSGINVGEPINASDIATKNYVDNSIGRNLFSTTFSVGANTNTSKLFSHGLGVVPSYVFCTIHATPAVGGEGPGIQYQIQSVTSSWIEVRIYNTTPFVASGTIYLEVIP